MKYKVGDKVLVVATGQEVDDKKLDELKGKEFEIDEAAEHDAEFVHLKYDGKIGFDGWWIGPECLVLANDGDGVEEIVPEVAPVKPKYKVGDKVLCIDAKNKHQIKEGSIYVVLLCVGEYVSIMNDGGNRNRYDISRFKKATPAIIAAYTAKVEAKKLADEKALKEKEEAEEKAFNERTAKARKSMYMEARVKLNEIAPKDGRVSCYAIVYPDGVTYNPNPHCHASIAGGKGRLALIDNIAYYLIRQPALKAVEDQYRDWVNYVMNEGPRSNCFVKQGVEAAFKHGIVYNSDRPIEEIIGACNQLREGSEYSGRLALFTQLRKAGFSGNVCYLLSYCISENMKFVGFDNSHKSMHDLMEVEQTFKFFREGYFLTKGKTAYNKSERNYGSKIAEWAALKVKEGETSINTFFKKGLKVDVGGGGFGAKGSTVKHEDMMEFATSLEPLVNKF